MMPVHDHANKGVKPTEMSMITRIRVQTDRFEIRWRQLEEDLRSGVSRLHKDAPASSGGSSPFESRY